MLEAGAGDGASFTWVSLAHSTDFRLPQWCSHIGMYTETGGNDRNIGARGRKQHGGAFGPGDLALTR